MKDSITFDELINSTSEELNQINGVSAVKTPFNRKKRDVLSDDEIQAKIDRDKMLDVAMKRDIVGESHVDKLRYDVTEGLKFYIKKLPQYQIITNQISILENEMDNYKKNGSKENYEKSKQIVFNLNSNLLELKKIVRHGESGNTNTERLDNLDKIKNSAEIKNLTELRKKYQIELNEATPSWWIKIVKEYRERIQLNNKFNSTTDDVIEFDEFNSGENKEITKITEVEQEYHNLCGRIADIIDWTVQEVLDANLNQISKALKNTLPLTWEIKNKLDTIKAEISYKKDELSGNVKLTDILFDSGFDLEKPEDLKISKELLALSNVNYVKILARKACTRYNALNKLDDAVSAGLEGLSVAINKWTTSQIKLKGEHAQSFKGFSSIYISGSIDRELLNIGYQGEVSGSSIATINHFNKKKINNFIKDNPQYENIDPSIVLELILGKESFDDDNSKSGIKKINKTMHATEFSGMVGGEEEGTDDIFENSSSSKDINADELLEGKIAYEKMLKSISDILNLFQTDIDKKTGIEKITNKRIFDKYERKIFVLNYGLETRIEKSFYKNKDGELVENTDKFYTQNEIAEIWSEMVKSDGIEIKNERGVYSQSAVSSKIDVILKKLKNILDIKPELKAGFEYFINIKKNDSENTETQTINLDEYGNKTKISNKAGNWRLNNPDLLKTLSNSREELGVKFDRDTLKDIYSDNQNVMNRQLLNGNKLSDAFQISDTNPLDDEIASIFGEF